MSLSGLLNALDGVGAQEGRILFATTNKYSALDAALCRPGRMDLHVEFKNASKYQARKLFSRFYLPTEISTTDDQAEEKEAVTDSGYVTDSRESSPTTDLPFTGVAHMGRAPKLSHTRMADLAERFADAIPERECSMASLQGYLMAYKTRPVDAANEASAWVESERAAELERTKKRVEVTENNEAKQKEEGVQKPVLSTEQTPAGSLPSPVSPICICGSNSIVAGEVEKKEP